MLSGTAPYYDPELGVAPGRRRGGEEEAVIAAILEKGGKGLWVPSAIVIHHIPTSRQTTKYVMYYYEGAGESAVFGQARYAPIPTMPFDITLKLVLAFIRLYIARRLSLSVWVRYLASYAYHQGRFKEWLAKAQQEN